MILVDGDDRKRIGEALLFVSVLYPTCYLKTQLDDPIYTQIQVETV